MDDEVSSQPMRPIDASYSQIGVMGDNAHVEGGIHFHTHTSPAGKPLQRPPRAIHFTDRKQELAQLLADLQPGQVVTLCGPGGIGKSALAAEALWHLAPGDEPPKRFADGIIFHTFYGRPDPALALEHIARSYGEEPKPTPAEAALRALANRQALLILDGTEEADNLLAVLEVRGNCGVLVTSRSRRDAVAERQDLKPLTADDAVALLRKWGGDQAADVQAAEAICKLLGYLPLAVRLAGRYLAETGQTAAEYLEWLQETPLEALDQGQRRLESVPILLARSLAQVSDPARQVLAVVGLLALVPFGRDPIAVALELPASHLYKPLGELVSYGLLSRPGERYEVAHALVHTYARERLSVPGEVIERLADYYTALAKEQSQRGLAGYLRLDMERAHMMRVLAECAERGEWAAVQRLVWAVAGHLGYMHLQGYWTERQAALELGLKAVQTSPNQYNEWAFLDMLATTYMGLGRVVEAIKVYEQALEIAQERGDKQAEGIDLGNLGIAYRALGQVERAIEYYEQALVIAREIGHRQGEGNQLGNLGNAYRDLGQVERAIEYYEQALAIAREIGHRQGEGNQLGNLGLAYSDLGQVERAIEYYEQGLVIAREIGDRQGEGNQLGNLGNAYSALGQVERAIEYYEQALVIAREIGHRQGEGIHLGNLGSAYRALGQVERAIEYYEQALVIAREIGDRQGEGIQLGNLGTAYRALGQVERAIESYEQGLVIAREIGYRQGEGARLGNLGNAYRDLGQVERAIEYYEQGLVIAREIGHRYLEGTWLYYLGDLYKNQANIPLARQYLEQARAIYEEIKSPYAKLVQNLLAELESDNTSPLSPA